MAATDPDLNPNPNPEHPRWRAACAQRLTYARELLSLGFIVSDSLDYSAREVRKVVQKLGGDAFASVLVLQRDYGYSQVRPSCGHKTSVPSYVK